MIATTGNITGMPSASTNPKKPAPIHSANFRGKGDVEPVYAAFATPIVAPAARIPQCHFENTCSGGNKKVKQKQRFGKIELVDRAIPPTLCNFVPRVRVEKNIG
jgi:hypothetical protein